MGRTVPELLRVVTSRELTMWQAYFDLADSPELARAYAAKARPRSPGTPDALSAKASLVFAQLAARTKNKKGKR